MFVLVIGLLLLGACAAEEEPAGPVEDQLPRVEQRDEPDSGSDCDPSYSGCIPSPPPDLDCPDIGRRVQVSGSDPHGLDRDGDGVGCETQ